MKLDGGKLLADVARVLDKLQEDLREFEEFGDAELVKRRNANILGVSKINRMIKSGDYTIEDKE